MATGEEVAIKLESAKTKHPQLLYESKIYRLLHGGLGIPTMRWFGMEGDYNVMVLDLLGPSLEDLFNYCSRRFTLKTVLMLADQLLSRLEYVHTKSFIHRDVKPDNFLIGLGKRQNIINIIDFGLAKKYRDPRSHTHIPYRDNKNLTGTARYASINTHIGIEQSRRDDLESLGYVLMYFIRGSLPWQGLKANTKKQKYERIMDRKMSTSTDQLCKGYPTEFRSYFEYCRSLRFEDRPDYAYLKRLFKELFVRKGYQYDNMFDWTILNLQNEGTRVSAERSVGVVQEVDLAGGGNEEDEGKMEVHDGQKLRAVFEENNEADLKPGVASRSSAAQVNQMSGMVTRSRGNILYGGSGSGQSRNRPRADDMTPAGTGGTQGQYTAPRISVTNNTEAPPKRGSTSAMAVSSSHSSRKGW
eukprot:CAMPEP_0171460826 /NCGR_PEP_ID=MMETSP0945-20130129/5543_1 /TAXON_ID=109269 /ORGANISM="Vaucheria litorea, Strain CCMP2940" /LENGTH=413 /DNA_ID=CAMNT_0011987099 /DNA_START=334 /DNA_END=1573 /DNA_ORIENTATION=+